MNIYRYMYLVQVRSRMTPANRMLSPPPPHQRRGVEPCVEHRRRLIVQHRSLAYVLRAVRERLTFERESGVWEHRRRALTPRICPSQCRPSWRAKASPPLSHLFSPIFFSPLRSSSRHVLQVEARWRGRERWFAAHVTKHRGNGNYDLQYADGAIFFIISYDCILHYF